MKHNFLNVFNQHRALQLMENGCDYADMTDDLVMIVANDSTVWVCSLDNSVSLNDAKLVQRLV
jgi:hypothetical protein